MKHFLFYNCLNVSSISTCFGDVFTRSVVTGILQTSAHFSSYVIFGRNPFPSNRSIAYSGVKEGYISSRVCMCTFAKLASTFEALLVVLLLTRRWCMRYFDRNIEMANGFETDLVRLIYYDIPFHFIDNYRSYEYHRVCLIIEGSKNVKINTGEKFTYDRNEFLILPPQSTVEMEITTPTRALVLELSDHLIDNVSKRVSTKWEIPGDFVNNSSAYRDSITAIRDEVQEIAALAMGKTGNREFLVDLNVQRMVYNLLTNIGTRTILLQVHTHPIAKAIALMHTHCTSGITLAEIAYAVTMSTSLFSLNFKKLTGITPLRYFIGIKLEKARELLRHQSVTDVSFDLGYSNISHFIRLFKKKFGLSPKKYQLKYYGSGNLSN
ncbi:MAG: AraC family transcriptional regulator [uncultured bacterium]|nr:MAG: AraC family transcriptional regulator [uncultured bacterium]